MKFGSSISSCVRMAAARWFLLVSLALLILSLALHVASAQIQIVPSVVSNK